jgi:hypothetical protein
MSREWSGREDWRLRYPTDPRMLRGHWGRATAPACGSQRVSA